MRYKIVTRQDSILVFDGDSPNYVASCQVFIYGDRGFMYNANGQEFYSCMVENGVEMMKEMKVVSLEGYVTKAHARLMRIALPGVADVAITGTGEMAGVSMVWVVIKPKVPA